MPYTAASAKRHQTNVRLAADEVRERIAALPDTREAAELVPAIFRDAKMPRGVHRAEVFRMLDERPGLFTDYTTGHWYRVLRICRNHHAEALFAAIR
jgi:hypothetical protein